MIDFLHNRELSDTWCDERGRLYRTGQYRFIEELRPAPSKVPTDLWTKPVSWWGRILQALQGNRRGLR